MSIQSQDYDTSQTDDENSCLLPNVVEKTGAHVKTEQLTGTSWYASIFLVVNAALGAGLLNFPDAYHQAGGVVIALALQGVFLVFIVAALLILAYCSDVNCTNTYQGVVLSMCGRRAHMLCAATIMFYCFGTCITFLIIIGDQWDEFFVFVAKETFCNDHPWYMKREVTICVTSVIFILPLCFPKRIDFLKYVSALGVVGIVYVAVMVVVKYVLPHTPAEGVRASPKSWLDVFTVVSVICFGYQCHVSIVPIYACLDKRNIKEYSKTISVAILLCVLSYSVTATCGYWTFGDRVNSDILLSYNPDTEVIIAVILIAVKTYTTYPILNFCGRAALESIWMDLCHTTAEQAALGEKTRRIITTLIWFIATLVLSIVIPNIGVVIDVLGSLAAIFIFVFPGMCLLKAVEMREGQVRSKKGWALAIFSCGFIVLGMFVFGVTVTQAIMQDIRVDKPAVPMCPINSNVSSALTISGLIT
ncbi:sodium-coupled neutral amino acid transporter 7-like [Liolophura sinensis]|uniref:sodium-coupled neutral amino acid transporter 7-like n=1 Tax=Liolophura sinensis TaxID=3198878 RepID=UPI003157F38C